MNKTSQSLNNSIKININLEISKDNLFVGRKIENKEIDLTSSKLNNNGNIKKYPIPCNLLHKKHKQKKSVDENNNSFIVKKPDIPINDNLLQNNLNKEIKKKKNVNKSNLELQKFIDQLKILNPEIQKILKNKILKEDPKIINKKKIKPLTINKNKNKNKKTAKSCEKSFVKQKYKIKKIEETKNITILNSQENSNIQIQKPKPLINFLLKNEKKKKEENQKLILEKNKYDKSLLDLNNRIRIDNLKRFQLLKNYKQPSEKIKKLKKSIEKKPYIFNKENEESANNKSSIDISKISQINKNKENSFLKKHTIKKWNNEAERRENLGLSFLNELNNNEYNRIIDRNRSKSHEKKEKLCDVSNCSKKKGFSENELADIRKFIYKQKEIYNLKKIESEQEVILTNQKKIEALNHLKEITRNNRAKNIKKLDLNSFQAKENSYRYVNCQENPSENRFISETFELDEYEKKSMFSENNYLHDKELFCSSKSDNKEKKIEKATIIIQKKWRDYRTRLILEEYSKLLVMGREEEQFLEYCDDNGVEASINNQENNQYINNSNKIIKKTKENSYDHNLSDELSQSKLNQINKNLNENIPFYNTNENDNDNDDSDKLFNSKSLQEHNNHQDNIIDGILFNKNKNLDITNTEDDVDVDDINLKSDKEKIEADNSNEEKTNYESKSSKKANNNHNTFILKEINENSKSLITIKDFENDNSELQYENSHHKTISLPNTGKNKISIFSRPKMIMPKDISKTDEIEKFKEEQLKICEEMLSNLNNLQSQNSNSQILSALKKLHQQTEQNMRLIYSPEESKSPFSSDFTGNRNPDLKSPFSLDLTGNKNTNNLEFTLQDKNFLKKKLEIKLDEELISPVDQTDLNNTNKSLDSLKLRQIEIMSDRILKNSSRSMNMNASPKNENIANSQDYSAKFGDSKNSNSVFKEDPFKTFTLKKYQEIIENKTNLDPEQVFDIREKVLDMRVETELTYMQRMLEKKKFSPKSFENKAKELEKWVDLEKFHLNQNKSESKKGWLTTSDSITRTKRDIEFLNKVYGDAIPIFSDNNLISSAKNIKSSGELEIKISPKNTLHTLTNENEDIVPISNEDLFADFQESSNRTDNSNLIVNSQPEQVNAINISSNSSESLEKQKENPQNQPEIKKIYLEDSENNDISDEFHFVQTQSLKSKKIRESISKTENITAEIVDLLITELILQNKDILNLFAMKSIIKHKETNEHFAKEKLIEKDDFNILKSQEIHKNEASQKLYLSLESIKKNLEGWKHLIKNSPEIKEEFLKNSNIPLGYSELEKLQFLNNNLYKFSIQISENVILPYLNREIPKTPVLKSELLIFFEKKFDFLDAPVLCQLLFDGFNESLNYVRPFGLKGIPNAGKSFKMPKLINDETMDNVIDKAIQKILEWTDFQCGLISDASGDEDILTQLREDKMAKMLASEVMETEDKWINYEEEEMEIKLEIGQLVWDEFLIENVMSLKKFFL